MSIFDKPTVMRPVVKCRWCGDLFEPNTNSPSLSVLMSHTYTHACDIRISSNIGIGDLVGYRIEKEKEPDGED